MIFYAFLCPILTLIPVKQDVKWPNWEKDFLSYDINPWQILTLDLPEVHFVH